MWCPCKWKTKRQTLLQINNVIFRLIVCWLLKIRLELSFWRDPSTGFLYMLWKLWRYEVWQKSNETDFLLTMNFILFANQGCPLKNSSLGQLHSDGSVVSILRSSAGRLLLEYLSARRLRSPGYYPKYQNGALSSGFWAGGIKRSHKDWDPANREAEEPQECFFPAKNSLMETAMWYLALSWSGIKVHAMPGHTRANLFPSLSRTSR